MSCVVASSLGLVSYGAPDEEEDSDRDVAKSDSEEEAKRASDDPTQVSYSIPQSIVDLNPTLVLNLRFVCTCRFLLLLFEKLIIHLHGKLGSLCLVNTV